MTYIHKPQLIALCSDFGNKDFRLSALKATILKENPTVNLVDISHEIPSFDLVQAAFIQSNAFRSFPEGSIHICWVFNVGEDRGILLALWEGQFFILPDNGLLSLICDQYKPEKIFRVSDDCFRFRERISSVIKHIVSEEDLSELFDPCEDPIVKINVSPVYQKDRIQSRVCFVDRFGNLIFNIQKDPFERITAGRMFSFHTKTHQIISNFELDENNVHNGSFYLYFNDAGYMVLALCGSNAAKTLDIKADETLQIVFE
ncbi:MAG: SAM-dependent chlorinase/fluorinase [Saprospiraceae bacterium]|nr:SAM-dependent chlorinase/fluorinase [Candidatus Vicinibacter affinis]MBP6171993.1 SAM-dependent chlorinase/fluorinase [Saprospiraceae bacterium]MBK7797784.1 SAM-dependent chlorinase/fluorinase [Candidatus Vicinibacter affinis]MBK8640993.1 SAM-dependent chlorinase/fluorinase [Candidatus Vicinibacter affinis]MBK9642301.1 SAM-dependent chlorinase/fluorinase [Candidatus Vicinibacter affinis]